MGDEETLVSTAEIERERSGDEYYGDENYKEIIHSCET